LGGAFVISYLAAILCCREITGPTVIPPESKSRWIIVLLVLVSCSALSFGQYQSSTANESVNVRQFLQQYLGADSYPSWSRPMHYFAGFVDLNGTGSNEVIVYLMNGAWCGSGGCTTLILAPEKSSYCAVTRVSATWPPIRILETRSHGWRDIGVWVQGGGIQPGYEAVLHFDGKEYPSNPSVALAKPADKPMAGTLVVPKGVVGEPLC
jgi:hypothetical protein